MFLNKLVVSVYRFHTLKSRLVFFAYLFDVFQFKLQETFKWIVNRRYLGKTIFSSFLFLAGGYSFAKCYLARNAWGIPQNDWSRSVQTAGHVNVASSFLFFIFFFSKCCSQRCWCFDYHCITFLSVVYSFKKTASCFDKCASVGVEDAIWPISTQNQQDLIAVKTSFVNIAVLCKTFSKTYTPVPFKV